MIAKKLPIWAAVVLMAAFMACGNGEQAQEPEGDRTAEAAEEAVAEEQVEVVETEEAETTEDEMVAWVMENCICPQCPSWIPEAAEKGEGGYCAVGISECIVDEAGCICPDCPVTQEKGLAWGYYCTRGSAAELEAQEQE